MKKLRYVFLGVLSLLLTPAFCLGQSSGFALLDTDSNGELTKKELKEYTEKIMPGFKYLDKFADRVDVDKDGTISEDELKGSKEVLRALSREVNGGEEPKKLSEAELKLVDEATTAYGEMAELISRGDWAKTAAKMTKQANDDYVIGLVVQSIAITEMELPPQIDVPAVNDAKDATIDVIEKYNLDDIDISSVRNAQRGIARPKIEDNDDDDDDSDSDGDQALEKKARAQQEKAQAEMDKIKAQIKATIDKNDQRWEIVAALRTAQKGSPFERDVFAGKVDNADVEDDAVFLTVFRIVPGRKIAIPTVLKMTAEKGNWKYAGIDRARTGKAMRQLVRGLSDDGAKAEPDTDF